MTRKDIGELVREAQEPAKSHAQHCAALLEEDRLADALEYCKTKGIEPPQCSLTAQSPNANKLRMIAKGMLSDEVWWKKRLKVSALRNFENDAMREGKVTAGVSDEMVEYMKAQRRSK